MLCGQTTWISGGRGLWISQECLPEFEAGTSKNCGREVRRGGCVGSTGNGHRAGVVAGKSAKGVLLRLAEEEGQGLQEAYLVFWQMWPAGGVC